MAADNRNERFFWVLFCALLKSVGYVFAGGGLVLVAVSFVEPSLAQSETGPMPRVWFAMLTALGFLAVWLAGYWQRTKL